MEDLKVDYDFSVRNNSGCIIQFTYGEDGMDSCSDESQSIMIMNMDTAKIIETFILDKKTEWNKILDKDTIKKMKKTKKYQKKLDDVLIPLLEYKENIFNRT